MGLGVAWDPGWVLLRKDTLERIAAGEVTVAFRWWTKPTVKAGGSLKTAVGVLAIASVEPIPVAAVSKEDAVRAGFASRAALLKAFPRKPGSRLYRVEFSVAGPDPRIALRNNPELEPAERARDRHPAGEDGSELGDRALDPPDAGADREHGPRPGPATSPRNSDKSDCRSRRTSAS